MRSLRIWEADCALLDVVLALSFDTEELLNSCQSGAVDVAGCGCVPLAQAAISAVHRACHEDSELARLIERRLNLVHRRELAELEALGVAALGAQLVRADLRDVTGLAGKLWALTTSSEPTAAGLRAHVRSRLTLLGARSLAPVSA